MLENQDVYSKMNIPIIAHEIGQWPVYPKWSEINKYTGVLKARNFEEFRAQAEINGIADQDIDFAKASGALNRGCDSNDDSKYTRGLDPLLASASSKGSRSTCGPRKISAS